MTKILHEIQKYILLIAVGLFPIFVLVNTTAPTTAPKAELFVVALSIALIIWIIKTLTSGGITFAVGRFDFPALLIVLAYLLSAIIKTPNKMEAFFIPGVATFVAVAFFVYLLINQLDKKGKDLVLKAFFGSGVLLALSIIFAVFGIFSKIPQLPAFIKDPLFNPMGGVVPTGVYLIPMVVFGIYFAVKEKDLVKRIFYGVSTAVIIISLVSTINNALPGKAQSPKFPNLQTSWEVAIATLGKSPIFGIGPSNYLSAFNQFRPVTYNSSELWSLRFTTATNLYLTLLTETGLLGLGALLVLLFYIYKLIAKKWKVEYLPLVVFLILLALMPVTPTLFIPLFILLALVSESEDKVVTLNTTANINSWWASKFPSVIFGLLILTGVIAVDYFGVKIVNAENTFTKSIVAFNANDAKQTYNLMQTAVNQNGSVDRYHASLAQVDMAIAKSLSTKKNLSDDDKKTITQLVQQSITEGKATVALNPTRSQNWELLAQTYRQIMPFAQGADQFTIQSYTQAITLDPINPNLRIALGGVYYALGRYDDAIDAFKLAALSKPDLANSHYNLSIAYKDKKDFDSAITEMKTVLSLVVKDSADYKTAQAALDDLEKNKPSVTTKGSDGQNLTAPKPLEQSNVKPQITLPEEANPPAGTQ